MLALQQCDALVAVLGTEALNHAAAVLLSVGRELLPVIRTVVIDHERVDGAGQRPARTDFNMGQARKSGSIDCHEFLRTGQARKRHRLAATPPEIVAHAFVLTTAVREGVDVFQLDVRHLSHSLPSGDTSSPFLNTRTIRPSRPISTRSTSAPAFRAARSARVRSVSLNVAGPCPMTSPMRRPPQPRHRQAAPAPSRPRCRPPSSPCQSDRAPARLTPRSTRPTSRRRPTRSPSPRGWVEQNSSWLTPILSASERARCAARRRRYLPRLPRSRSSLNCHVRRHALTQRSESNRLLHGFCIGLANLQKLAAKFLVARIVGRHEHRPAQINLFLGRLSA